MKKKVRNVEQVTLKALKELDLRQQLLFVESYLPDAWEYLHDINKVRLPKFNENDEVISWGVTPQDTPQVTPQDVQDAKEEQS